jgi:ABC-2 type transport system ATP-binding protein
MTEFVIETHGLTKRYDGHTAVDSLDLQVRQGEVYGLLGPNGSGKTTTILMLLGLTEPSAGQARILGFDPMREPLKVKARVGYMPDQVGFYNNLTARENLIYIAKLIGLRRARYVERIPDALARIGLSQVADKRVSTFSHGMRQRLAVAALLLKDPQRGSPSCCPRTCCIKCSKYATVSASSIAVASCWRGQWPNSPARS